MKIVNYILIILVTMTTVYSFAWINETMIVTGKIKGFDKKTVSVDNVSYSMKIPRKAIHKSFVLRSSNQEVSIPVYSKHFKNIEIQSKIKRKISNDDTEAEELFLAADKLYEKIKDKNK